ncbi:cyanophycin metabolism-associated DUF1854 family protein [Singulisphaera acidiphila]|uniref:DUF1854 domain-containing protein n=1 Tax=Singulisphaera acidiphila (strain ATCC BAA-1392 / DSM 18658 / VKM B-2454 / MOB10) TaxID=886293 RepID=L0DIA4_SINAD|nr:DUF1854 domain-containing protein [Singulisphaera acidiphila]AGA29129.1 protein of unknown function (DUF1854) [Singulisphaera acidiphila DSM 18658]
METVPASGSSKPSLRPFGLSQDAWGRLVLIDADGKRHVGVEPVRAFPITDPGLWVSLCDPNGREILCIESLDDLSPSIRQILEGELALREFTPVIKRILRLSGEISPSDWDVETDRGATRFTLDTEDDVRRISAHRVLITDSQKLRYQVPDVRLLDLSSRRILERFL